MTDHTLTTEEVRRDYMWGVHACGCCAEMKEADAEAFDRWLAQVKAEAQVEALREVGDLAKRFSREGTPPLPWSAQATALSDRADRIAREAGIETGEANACPDHKPVQHRDGKPPWCRACGKTAANTVPNSRFSGEAGA